MTSKHIISVSSGCAASKNSVDVSTRRLILDISGAETRGQCNGSSGSGVGKGFAKYFPSSAREEMQL